jgi:epoxyqueuosine reductase
LAELATLQEEEFREVFRHTPVWRTKYEGFLRNVAIAMGNSGRESMRKPLILLARHPRSIIADTAKEALIRLEILLSAQVNALAFPENS